MSQDQNDHSQDTNNKSTIFMDNVKDYSKGVAYAVGKGVDIVSPYIPLFDIAVKLIKEIIDIYDATQFNRNTCERLMERRKKDFESLEEDIEEMKKILIYTQDVIFDKIKEVEQEVLLMKSQSGDKTVFKPTKIETDQLHICDQSDKRIKRIYKHIDIECKPIDLSKDLTKSYEPKIANFDIAREFNDMSKEIPDLKVLRWMAFEKMEGKTYDTKCEIF
ncbi:307_t:CDS:2, partial [Cetraspora pellucida]